MKETIEHEGFVMSVNGSMARVQILQASACAGCHAKQMCMAADSKEKEVDVQMVESLKVGDRVHVYGESRLGLTAVLLAYGLPFLILVVMVFVLGHFIESEGLVGTIAILSLIPYFVVLRLFNNKLSRKFVFYAKKTDEVFAE